MPEDVDNVLEPLVTGASGKDGLEPAAREPAQGQVEHGEEDDPDPEGRHIVEEQGGHNRRTLADSPSPPGDVGTDDDTHDVLRDEGAPEQDEGPRDRLREEIRDRPAVREGGPELEGEHVAEVDEVADYGRLVEPELRSEPREEGPEPEVRSELRGRVARHRLEQDEDDRGHDEDSDERLHYPPDDEPRHRGHVVSPCRLGSVLLCYLAHPISTFRRVIQSPSMKTRFVASSPREGTKRKGGSPGWAPFPRVQSPGGNSSSAGGSS